MPKTKTSFKKGNQVASKSPKVVLRKFTEMLNNAKDDKDILCFQDACMSIGWRSSKVDYWVNKLAVFETFKKDIQDIITSRINKGALHGDYQPTASIWRMKQLGEKDQQYQEIDNKHQIMNNDPLQEIRKMFDDTNRETKDSV